MSTRFMNDGSTQSPRLEVHQGIWAMVNLGNGQREWTLEEKFEKMAEAGFTGVMAGLPAPQEAAHWRNLLDQYNFAFGLAISPASVEEARPLFEQANAFGVQYVNAQVKDNFVIGTPAINLLSGLVEAAAEANLPFFAETHRGIITQDLHRTVEYVQAIPDLHLTLDLSHYVVAGGIAAYSEKAEELFDILLPRAASIHARVSNGQQVQVDIGPEGTHPMVEHFTRWWEKGMAGWLSLAKPGDIFPYVCELGPASYSITLPGTTQEISDRWQQALVFKKLAEQCWERVSQKAALVSAE